MHLRRASALTAVLALAATLGLSACATTVTGSAVPVAGGATGERTGSGKPTSTKPSSTGDRKDTSTKGAPESGSTKPAGKVKIGTKKKTSGYEDCDILSPEDVAGAIGAQKAGEKGCVQSTESPFAVVLFMVTFAEYEGEAREIEVGGNTAYEVKEKGGDCSVVVMLTDDPSEITPAFLASVTPIDSFDPCEVALKLATKGFEKIPNA
ncbi:hypothetical protein [Saccharothrix australiensis]|uniref:Uncharacterized protein DUF3558 n=1 Tax=Saccharothrix australiensis TaxID=2072 RepID=A0A495VYB6_9PSEU|nr:hypothetical protein [Saccharothrix australiensis]RKT53385.1 uncharacterized protein DUF3558 [Saccharothrix australiensis]